MAERPSQRTRVLGGFELVSKIGRGGMGSVFKARQLSMDRLVALKILPPKIAKKDPQFVDRFIREARVAGRLNHPHIVQGIEVGQDEDTKLYYFAMEYIDGPNVGQLLRREGCMPERRARKIVLAVARALVAVHRAGIVHRDIKPDNILMTSRNEPKLADLGLAKRIADEDEGTAVIEEVAELADVKGPKIDAGVTQAGRAVGTAYYMAPEQVKGHLDKIDIRTDLYALGASLLHMVTGKPPFDGGKAKEIMKRRLAAPVPDAQEMNPSVSEETSRIISRLMQKDPADRYQTPDELVKDLGALVEHSATEELRRDSVRLARSTGQSSIRRPALPNRKNALFLAGGALLGVSVAAFVALLLTGGGDSSVGEDPETKVTQESGTSGAPKEEESNPDAGAGTPDAKPPQLGDEAPQEKGTDNTKPEVSEKKASTPRKGPTEVTAPLRSVRMLIRQASRLWEPPMAELDFRMARVAFDAYAARKELSRRERIHLESTFRRAVEARLSSLVTDARALSETGREEAGLRKLAKAKFDEVDADKEWDKRIAAAATEIRERLQRRKEAEEKERVAQAARAATVAFESVMRTVHAHFAAGEVEKAKSALDAARVRSDLASQIDRLRQEREAVGWLHELSLLVEAGARKLMDGRPFQLELKDGRKRDVGAGGLEVTGLRNSQIVLERTGLTLFVRLSSLSTKTRLELALLASDPVPKSQATIKAKWVYGECVRWKPEDAENSEAWKQVELKWVEARNGGAAPAVLALVGGWMVRARNRVSAKEIAAPARDPSAAEINDPVSGRPRIPGLLEGDLEKPNAPALLATSTAVHRKWGVKTFFTRRMTVPRGPVTANIDATGGLQRLYGLLVAKRDAVRDPLVAKLAFMGFRWAFAKHAAGIFTQSANHELLARYAKGNPELAAEIWADLLYCMLSEPHAKTHTVRVFESLNRVGNSVATVAPLRSAAYALLRPRFEKAYANAKGRPGDDRLYHALAHAFLDGRIDDDEWVALIKGGPQGRSAGLMPTPWGIEAARMGSTEGLAIILNAIRSGVSAPAHSTWLCQFEYLAGISESDVLRGDVYTLSGEDLRTRAAKYLSWLRENASRLKWVPGKGRFNLNGVRPPGPAKAVSPAEIWKDKAFSLKDAQVGDWVRWQADRTWSDTNMKVLTTQVLRKVSKASAELQTYWHQAGMERRRSGDWPIEKPFLPQILPEKLFEIYRCTQREDAKLTVGKQSYDCLRTRWELVQKGGGKDIYEVWTCPTVPLGGVVKTVHTVAGRRITTVLVSSGRSAESK